MADFSQYPAKYLLFNAQRSKNLAIVMQIEGIPDLYGISETFTKVRYGDPGIVYGLPGLVYGGLRRVSGAGGAGSVKPYIVLDTSMSIGQRIEPEQGKGNIGTLTMTLIDKNGEISRIITPGLVVDEIMAKREVKIWLGFQQTSFPEDYLLVYKGYITSLDCPPGLVKFQISDSMSKKRQPLFNTPTTNLSSAIDSSTGFIPVDNSLGFHQQILGPDGTYDTNVGTYIRIDDEIMEYDASGILSPIQFLVTRGQLGTAAAAHEIDASVSNGVRLGSAGNQGINCVTLALKLLLSGWAGPCESNVSILSFVYTYDLTLGYVPNAFLLETVDAKKDLGLTVGDYFYISGASNSGNNTSGVITQIVLLGDKYQILYTDQTFILENPSSAVASFRSKYDTFPTSCGAKCRMRDVDVETMEYIRDNYFVASATSNMSFYIDSPITAKDLIDTNIFLPVGCYSISRFGKISMSITKPPLPGVGKLVEIDWTSVLDPDKIHVTRATNSRTFFNLISFEYNKVFATGEYTSVKQFLDLDSLNLFDQVSTLPIQAPGLRDEFGGATIAQIRGRALLQRYKNGALVIELTVNWSVGSLIEVSDIVLLRDEGKLKIMNFETGERNLGVMLLEVIDRQYNITAGQVKLKLMGGLGFDVDSRFALYSPSSLVSTGSTSTEIRIQPSFGQTAITSELGKWTSFKGLPILVHNADYSVSGQTTLVGIGNVDPSSLDVDPPLGFTPTEDMIVDIADYPTSTDPAENKLYKTLYTYTTPTIPITSVTSQTVFEVGAGDVGKLTVGNKVIIHNADFTDESPEIAIESIVGTTVTLKTATGFTFTTSYVVEGIGFHDGTSYYRYG
jgi:hypothetical protein